MRRESLKGHDIPVLGAARERGVRPPIAWVGGKSTGARGSGFICSGLLNRAIKFFAGAVCGLWFIIRGLGVAAIQLNREDNKCGTRAITRKNKTVTGAEQGRPREVDGPPIVRGRRVSGADNVKERGVVMAGFAGC
jgi:hypothetical protein